VALAHSSEHSQSIYDEGEQVFGTAERDALVSRALTPARSRSSIRQGRQSRWGLPFTRFNRIEGFSTGVAIDDGAWRWVLAHALVRLGVADLSPNGERLSIGPMAGERSASASIAASLHRTIGATRSASAARCRRFFGRERDLFRTWGAELKGKGLRWINDWRRSPEQQLMRRCTPNSHRASGWGEAISRTSTRGECKIVGLAVGHHSS